MVNKSLLGISVVVLVAALSVGVVVGMQIGGPAAAPEDPGGQTETADGGGGDGGDGGSSTSTPTTETPATATATVTATPVETATAQQTEREPYVPARYYDEAEIERFVVEFVNERRANRKLDPMSASGTTANQLSSMAGGHSVAMAEEGRTLHEIDGVDSADRYRRNDLYESCKFQAAGKSYIRYPDGANFEAIGKTVAGHVYTDDGQERFNGGEREVAKAIVKNWFETQPYRDRLTYQNAKRMGVGINVTEQGDVYATANVCG
ncbi:CAP domain-containing protein [Halomicroarcula sp. F13]|uniref:CAP domain-containing protein n=1 Tax=Haloarcula rubra TaxID=2487747 RepID=A0AAW4PKD2_9EURY|nr:CAP domain-containing protein [Halomicroarcula rubra]MBX0321527.1 CAP domain-containing protein [Halomicroarcula rubra]